MIFPAGSIQVIICVFWSPRRERIEREMLLFQLILSVVVCSFSKLFVAFLKVLLKQINAIW